MNTAYSLSLNPSVIAAVNEEFSAKIENSSNSFLQDFASLGKVDPAQIAVAVAYTRLCREEPEMVTSSHVRLLRKNFSFDQIQELTVS